MEDTLQSVEFIVRHILYVLTAVTLICGVLSWWLMPKFRTYRNFVLLGALLSNIVCLIVYHVFWDFMFRDFITLQPENTLSWKLIYLNVTYYLATVRDHWLIVISHMFYVDIVKVFNGQIRRRYLKSVLFCLGVPLIVVFLRAVAFICYVLQSDEYSIISMIAFCIIQALPPTLNSLLYIVTVYSLYRSSNTRATTSTNRRHKFYIASLIFILGEGWILFTHCLEMSSSITTGFTVLLDMYFQPLLMIVFLFVLKSNRGIWCEFVYANKLNYHDINNQERNIQNHAVQVL